MAPRPLSDPAVPGSTRSSPNRPAGVARTARHFAGLHILDGGPSDVAVSSRGRDGDFSFAICLQTAGRGHVSHDDMRAAIVENEAFVVAPLSRFAWHPAGPDSRGLIAAGGPAFSLRFRPHQLTAVRLGARHPVALLLKDCVEQLKGFIPTAESTVTQKLAEVLADLAEIAVDEANGPVDDQAFLNALAGAEKQLDDPQFDVSALAGALGTTLRSLQKRFQLLNTTPRQWMSERRLERMRRKLDDPAFANLSIKQIAFGSGFRDFSHFSRSFKDAFGVPPRRYRR
ncbi:MAG: helix-turn-helix transcriptional regulator [Xanthobacteraceae bacterium]|nr:helix-turn-helix transcriptional regulator [Xanthobacteraceae bacterium]